MSAVAVRRPAPPPIDVATEPALHGLFTPQIREVDAPDLVVEGDLPAEIEGDYVRNGPNPRFPPLGAYLYPTDGDGMIHRVQFRDGKVRYRNRFVRTPAVVTEEAAGRSLWPGTSDLSYTPGPDLVGPRLAHTVKDRPSINVVRHSGRLLALAESAPPFSLSTDLDTIAKETFLGMLPAGITAHPKIDPATGELVLFCCGLTEPFLTWSVIGADGVPSRAQSPVEGVRRPVLIHDMALTRTYVVLVVSPFFRVGVDGSPLSWEPDQGTRIALIPRDGSRIRWLSTEAFWLGHTVNAYDTVGPEGLPRVVLDYVRWRTPNGFGAHGTLARLTMNPTTGQVDTEALDDRSMDFPRIDDRMLTRKHRQVAVCVKAGRRDSLSGDADTLAWYDSPSGRLDQWAAGDLAVGEQTFVPRPGDPDPTQGWWIVLATDRIDLTSRLLVFAAADPAAGPVASVHLPQRVPLGLHGAWFPAPDLRSGR